MPTATDLVHFSPLRQRTLTKMKHANQQCKSAMKTSNHNKLSTLNQLLLLCGISSLLIACDGNTELMKHTLADDPIAVQAELAKGAVVDERNKYGWTALMHAARQNKTSTMALLLDAGADINVQDDDGWTPLMRAASKGNDAATQLLLQRKANTESTDSNGWTALMWAANRGHLESLTILISAGANVNEQAKDGRTAFALARNEEYNDILDALKAAGAEQ